MRIPLFLHLLISFVASVDKRLSPIRYLIRFVNKSNGKRVSIYTHHSWQVCPRT